MNRINIALLIVLLLSVTSCKPKYDETSPKIAPVTEAVFASGVIEPKDAYTVTSLFDGYIVRSYVAENDLVKDGQLLFQLDNRQQRTQVAIAATNMEFAKINAAPNSPDLLQQKAQIEVARVKMLNDSINLSRNESLLTSNSVSRQDVDNARMNYQSSYILRDRMFYLTLVSGISQGIRSGTVMPRLVISQRCSTKDIQLRISCGRWVIGLKECSEMQSHTKFCNRLERNSTGI